MSFGLVGGERRDAMRAAIVVPTRFHAFHTAAQLRRKSALHSVLTGLPWLRIARHSDLPRECFRPLTYALLPFAGVRFVPSKVRRAWELDDTSTEFFDRMAARNLPAEANVCIGYAGLSLHTLRAARRLGALTVVERHSAHRRAQMELLAAEHDAFGLKFDSSERIMARELEEYELADVISVPSEFVARSFVEQGMSRAKILKAPLGADLGRFAPVPRTDHRFRVLFVGAFTLQKGVQYLLQAWSRLRIRSAELVFVGLVDPAVRECLQPDAIAGVRMLGPIPQPQLASLFSNADVLCLPSIQDGFGMVMAEAMACGLPVIHSTNTGGAELVEPGITGFEVPIRDPDAIAAAIQSLLDDPARQKEMSAAALEHARRLGGWNAYGELYVGGLREHLRAGA